MTRCALVLSGGIGLGVYHAGAYSALHAQNAVTLDWIAGSSIGGVVGAVIAGNSPEARLERLRELWIGDLASLETLDARSLHGPWRNVQNWASVLQARVAGVPGHFHPRFLSAPFERFTSLYDLSPLRARIENLVDFDRLNSGDIRFTLAATDISTGELVLFDTAQGDRIALDHLMASCGYLPEFAPLKIGDRLLGDGGLSANAPLEGVFLREDRHAEERVCFVVDLFPRDGGVPTSLQTALARKNDLMFANQTFMRLRLLERVGRMTDRESAASIKAVFYLSYRGPPDEAGAEKTFDLSRATVSERWQTGALDMEEALRRLAVTQPAERGWTLEVVRRQ